MKCFREKSILYGKKIIDNYDVKIMTISTFLTNIMKSSMKLVRNLAQISKELHELRGKL